MKDLENRVKKAKTEKKIFMFIGGYETVRQILLDRGWIEKISKSEQLAYIPPSERLIMSGMMKNLPFYFIWQPRNRPVQPLHVQNVMPYVNSISRQRLLDFTTKDGLDNCAQNYHWYHVDGITDLNYQRSHIMVDKATKDEFCEDFRRTALIGFLTFLNESQDFLSFFKKSADLSTECVEFAIQKLELLIRLDHHEDLDSSQLLDLCIKFPKNQNDFLINMRQVMNGTRKFKLESYYLVEMLKSQVFQCCELIKEHWPFVKYDGHNNLWIAKPIGQSSGTGVVVMNDETKILNLISTSAKKFVVQKYIERPLIIHQRKFDMRIYFLTLIREESIQLFVYKDCYIKFSSSPFNLNNLHQSIHITNFAVQKFFMNKKSESIPKAQENMWPLKELKTYFENIGKTNIWEEKIYASIKRNLKAIIIASLEVTNLEANNFELNGVDFMVRKFMRVFSEIFH